MARPIVKVTGLTKVFNSDGSRVYALSNVNLDVGRGDFVAIMGPSGSGKTTLLTLLGCLDRPTKGRILLGHNGLDVSAMAEALLYRIRRKHVGFIFQSFNLIPSLTALENVQLPMEGLIRSGKRRRKRARVLLNMVDVLHRENHRPFQMSAGEQQRVAIARALANGPAVILADEPTGNLDSETGAKIIELLRRLSSQQRRTIIMVTHDPLMASFATRSLFLRDGRLYDRDPTQPQTPTSPA
ncbi:MAG: ABC transporter ATP-binding protein [Chloroflexota bacterium]